MLSFVVCLMAILRRAAAAGVSAALLHFADSFSRPYVDRYRLSGRPGSGTLRYFQLYPLPWLVRALQWREPAHSTPVSSGVAARRTGTMFRGCAGRSRLPVDEIELRRLQKGSGESGDLVSGGTPGRIAKRTFLPRAVPFVGFVRFRMADRRMTRGVGQAGDETRRRGERCGDLAGGLFGCGCVELGGNVPTMTVGAQVAGPGMFAARPA